MNKFKFRAWDKYCEQMVYDTPERIFGNYPEESIMQFTGFQDKNGKDIYEGDVVIIRNIDKEEDYKISDIVLREGQWCLDGELDYSLDSTINFLKDLEIEIISDIENS